MESSLRKYVHGGKMKEEIMKVESSDDEGSKEDMTHIKGGNGNNNRRRENSTPPPSSRHNTPSEKKEANSIKMEGSSSAETNLRISSSTSQKKEDPLALAKAEMGEVIEENQRLKIHLDKITKDYQALQMQFNEFLQQEPTTKSTTSSTHINTEEPHDDLVSLSLGRTSSIDVEKTHEPPISAPNKEGENGNGNGNRGDHEKGLLLGLGYKLKSKNDKEILGESSTMSPEKSVEEVREEGEQTWPPQKIAKRSVEDEISQQNPTKRARVSLRVRCDSPTMNDGCQWRKYGQKIAKGNPCPRAYYRCTVATNCPVRKQVQRCAEDMSILITTYEGTHNHPLPVAATAIASTTSAAARMLLSGSSTSSSSSTNPSYHNSTLPSTNINGLNYYFSADNSKSKPFYLPNSTISSSPSAFPTITLDLTSTSSSSSLSHLTRITNFSPRQPSTNLNFSSSESNTLPLSWSNQNNQINSFNFQRQPFYQENIYQPYTFKNMSSMPQDTLAEATKAITSDPNFQSALVEALSSIIGSSSRSNLGNLGDKVNKVPSQSLRIGDQSFPILSSFASTQNSANCASNFLNMNPSSMSSNSQSGSVFSLHPSSPFPLSKSKSTSPDDTRDHPL